MATPAVVFAMQLEEMQRGRVNAGALHLMLRAICTSDHHFHTLIINALAFSDDEDLRTVAAERIRSVASCDADAAEHIARFILEDRSSGVRAAGLDCLLSDDPRHEHVRQVAARLAVEVAAAQQTTPDPIPVHDVMSPES